MGLLRTLFLITTPVTGMVILAFRLGRKLPPASRLFGNYIGLGYVYFKSVLKFVKPVDQMPFEMISLARKTSQQSQALRRQLKATLKRVREDFKAKKEETFKQVASEVRGSPFNMLEPEQQRLSEKRESVGPAMGNQLIFEMMMVRRGLLESRSDSRKSSKFFKQL